MPQPKLEISAWLSTWIALVSMLMYTSTNIILRCLEGWGVPIDWMLAIKETVAVSVLLPWILIRIFQNRYRFVSKRLVFYLVCSGFICQVFGAQNQLWAYAVVGLIVSVPIIQAVQLIGTACVGHFWLKDHVSRTRFFAISLLICAVCILSVARVVAVNDAEEPPHAEVESVVESPYQPETVTHIEKESGLFAGKTLFILGSFAALITGISYSIHTLTIRYVTQRYRNDFSDPWDSFRVSNWIGHDFVTHTQIPNPPTPQAEVSQADVSQTGSKLLGLESGRIYSPFPITLIMIIVTGAGVLFFGTKIIATRGFHGLLVTPEPWWWYWILLAGVLNLIGFFFQVQGLLLASAAKVSLISASQIVILALVGILFFNEPMSLLIVVGVVLTITGVIFSSTEN